MCLVKTPSSGFSHVMRPLKPSLSKSSSIMRVLEIVVSDILACSERGAPSVLLWVCVAAEARLWDVQSKDRWNQLTRAGRMPHVDRVIASRSAMEIELRSN